MSCYQFLFIPVNLTRVNGFLSFTLWKMKILVTFVALFSLSTSKKERASQRLSKELGLFERCILKQEQKLSYLNLVGHSLGTIIAADDAFDQEKWIENRTVDKVISIAGRLKNIDKPIETPFYPYCYETLKRIELIYERIKKNRDLVQLYTIVAENDWLIPRESVLISDKEEQMAMIPIDILLSLNEEDSLVL